MRTVLLLLLWAPLVSAATVCPQSPCICGDVNNDGVVTLADSTMIGRYVGNRLLCRDIPNPRACDVNNDRLCNGLDAEIVADCVNHSPPCTLTCTPWACPTPTYYLSPTGNNANTGLDEAHAWKTFAYALPKLRPGDLLFLGDGTYSAAAGTGVPSFSCGASPLPPNGTTGRPITIRAIHDRKAHILGDGHDAFYMAHCTLWNLEGLYVSNVDNASVHSFEGNVIYIYQGTNLNLRRLLVDHANTTCDPGSLGYCNDPNILVEQSSAVLVEDTEIYRNARHGIDFFQSLGCTARRVYVNPRDRALTPAQNGSTGIIFYGTSNSIIENCIGEGIYGWNVAGSDTFQAGTPGGYDNQILGSVSITDHGVSGGEYLATVRGRNFSGSKKPVGRNTIKNSVAISMNANGISSRGAYATTVENVSSFSAAVDGLVADQDLSEPFACSDNPNGCSVTIRNSLVTGSGNNGIGVNTAVVNPWLIDYANSVGNAGAQYPTGEAIGDASGNIQHSLSVTPTGMGTAACLLWVPATSNMHGAGLGGADIGANILYRYQAGALTPTRLWNPTTGAFPCGAIVVGVNDNPANSCSGVHTRLHVNSGGCPFPAGY